MALTVVMYCYIFLVGMVVGSFLNVCIYRIPKHEEIVVTPSHCMGCGTRLKWFELVPLLSWVLLKGRCRSCGCKVSPQYPLVELLNGVLWAATAFLWGFSPEALIFCMAISALLVLSYIDFKTYEIPFGINLFLLLLGVLYTLIDYKDWVEHILGFFCVSGLLMALFVLSKGKAIGGGDVKLMAAVGLLIGWKLIILAFLLGCFYGSVIHITRMKWSHQGHILAMGPYLSMGIVTALWFGDGIINWYLSSFAL